MKKFYFSFDVGGTDIKYAIISESGEILCKTKTPTKQALKTSTLGEAVVFLAKELAEKNNLKFEKASGIGIGLPGMVEMKSGTLKYAGNLGISDYNIIRDIKALTTIPVKTANDADLCALAELKQGVGKDFNSFVMIAIGTGIGAGIVVDGKLIPNNYSGEIGHMKVSYECKIKCHCDETGCYESFASTRALIRLTKEAMQNNPKSKMWKTYDLDSACGKTVFEYQNDATAKKVLKDYISYLGDGIVSVVNIIMPEAIILSGAISNQKDLLIKPLEEYVNKHIFARHAGAKIKIIPASNTSDAGIIGARYLF